MPCCTARTTANGTCRAYLASFWTPFLINYKLMLKPISYVLLPAALLTSTDIKWDATASACLVPAMWLACSTLRSPALLAWMVPHNQVSPARLWYPGAVVI